MRIYTTLYSFVLSASHYDMAHMDSGEKLYLDLSLMGLCLNYVETRYVLDDIQQVNLVIVKDTIYRTRTLTHFTWL